ncbi:MAG: NAD(P)-dependent oxidoreductase [Verrucomicrobia bacterium]|nr:NAD(P)-dependent oxidoreductase [Verrucomicrobiota bacterium]MCG2679172.1 NAD(P)-dependent oxidoreductase [Kiritimatiellia bacterium]MBU4247906.1 NAD(P)-dependent oxidoreductase [Verrucomicrobiota bacterium]MBU4291284.1 NAD(P)-dependent oxidoreductase [Verrucomicrobiota bacterium]MBU4429466.1 NAD(P)-dependent oxidoreductase [Verrucomicrobiota bacterium]
MLRIKNIFITGGSGKIGRALLPELVKAGYRIRALEFDEKVKYSKSVEVMSGDLRDVRLAEKALQDMDAVIHLANCKENRELFLDTNIKGTFYLLDESKKCGHLKQFIQAGSDARVGIFYYPHPFPIDETMPHQAYPGYYAFSKVLEETMCEQYVIQYKLPVTVLRFSWVHDEDDILAHLTLKVPNFGVPVWKELAKTQKQKEYFRKKADGVACLVHPGGQPGIRHIVGIKDVVQGIMLSIGNQAAIGQAFSITGPAPFSYGVAAEYAAKILHLPVVLFTCDYFHDLAHSIVKARSILGYNPLYDITRIIDDAVAFRQAGKKRTPTKYIG